MKIIPPAVLAAVEKSLRELGANESCHLLPGGMMVIGNCDDWFYQVSRRGHECRVSLAHIESELGQSLKGTSDALAAMKLPDKHLAAAGQVPERPAPLNSDAMPSSATPTSSGKPATTGEILNIRKERDRA